MSTNNFQISKPVRLAQVIFLLLALAMAVFGAVTLFRHNAPPWAAVLMLVDAVLLGLAAWLITHRSRLLHLLAVCLVAGNAILTITDQFGWADAAVLAAFLTLLVLLVVRRAQFAQAS